MTEINSDIQEALSKIPPIFSKTTIQIVQRDLKTFFSTQYRPIKTRAPNSVSYPISRCNRDFKLSFEEQNYIKTALNLNSPQTIIFLTKTPKIGYASCQTNNIDDFINLYTKDIYYDFVTLAFYGENLDLINFIFFKIPTPKPPLWPKPRYGKGVPWLLGPDYMPLFSPNLTAQQNGKVISLQYMTTTSPILRLNRQNPKKSPYALAHFSALSCNHTQVFYGLNNGTILIEPYPNCRYAFSYSIDLSSYLNKVPYSLVWAKEALWAFTENLCICLDISTSTISFIKTHFPNVFPVHSDGNYFYSMTNSNRFVTVFTFIHNKLQVLKKVRLEKTIDRIIPFTTNGLFITFADVENTRRIFKQFSLVNGAFIRQYTADFQQTEFAFCNSPYRQQHVVLTNFNLVFLTGNYQLPRWAMGLPFPDEHLSDLLTNFDSLYYALYHDKQMFFTVRFESIRQMANEYIQANNDWGIYLVGMLLCKCVDRRPTNLLNNYFLNAKGNIRLYICFVYLVCLSSHKNQVEETIRIPNIINTFLEEDYPPIFIWLFPKYFNLRRIELSGKAIMKLITYASSYTSLFPVESFYILSAFLKYAFSNIENDIEKFTAPLNAITIGIEQKVMSFSGKKGLSDVFVNSVDYKIWKELLMLIYQNRKNWFYLSSSFAKFFGFSLLNSEIYCGELNCLMNCSLYIFLSLFSNISFALNPPFYNSIEDFFKEYRHPMNGVYFNVDQKVFNLLSKCNDIPSKDEFSKYFFQFRNFFIFEAPSLPFRTYNSMMSTPSQNLEYLLTNHKDEQLSIRGVIQFIFENNKHELIQLQSHSIISWFINLIETRELNEYQQCIFSIFLPMFEKFKVIFCQFLQKNNPSQNFIDKFIYPFLFPHEIILSLPNFTCSVFQIIQYPYDLLNISYKNIIKCYSRIMDATQIMLPFIDRLTKNDELKPTALLNPDSEKAMLHDSLLWLIGFKCGELIDFRHYSPTFLFLFRNTSRINVRIAMRWIYTAEKIHDINIESLFFEMLDIIADYLFDMKNPLHTIKEPFEVADTVFTINHYCRKLFNLESNIFRNSLLKYLFNETNLNDLKLDELEFDKKKWLAAFSILNNSIDLIRKHAQITVIDEDFISVSGKIRDYTILRSKANVINSVIIEKDDETQEKIRLNKCIQLWTTPINVKLSLLLEENEILSQVFQKVFNSIEFEYDYQNTFKLASLNAFLKIDSFRNSLTPEFIKKNIELDPLKWPNYYMMDNSYLNYSYFLTISHLPLENNSFIFSSYEDDLLLNINNEGITDDYEPLNMKTTFSGKQDLITLDEEIAFKSLPLHPRLHSMISMRSVPSITFSLEFFGMSDTNNSILKYGPIKHAFDTNENEEEVELFKIEVIPQKSIISVSIYQQTESIKISMPPLTMLYVVLRMGQNAIAVVDYQVDPEIYDLEITQEDNQSDRMILIENDTIKEKSELPSNDSKTFNFTSLELSARNLNRTLKQLNVIAFPNIELPPSALINFLFYSNPLFSDKSLNFDEMLSIPLWLTTAKELRQIVLKQITKQTLAEIEAEIYLRKQTWNGVDIQTNRSYIVSKNASESEISKKKFLNCYLMADDTYQIIGMQKTQIDLTDKMIILPYLLIHGTNLQIAIHFRHLISLYRSQHIETMNIAPFLEMTKLKKKEDANIDDSKSYFSAITDQFKPIFGEILNIFQLIFPAIPDKSEKPIFPQDSLFIKESIVHDYPNIFFFHKYFELTSPRFPQQPFTCNKYPMYFTTENKDTAFSINNNTFQGNQFAILYDQFEQIPLSSQGISVRKSFRVKCNDPNALFIFDVVPEFHKIDAEFRAWENHHTFQLLFSMLSNDNLKETYAKLPLSKQFSFKTANFVYKLTKKHQMRMKEYVNNFENRFNILPLNSNQPNKMKIGANNEYFNIRSKLNNIQLSEIPNNNSIVHSDPSLDINHQNSIMPRNQIIGPMSNQNSSTQNLNQSYIQYIPQPMPGYPQQLLNNNVIMPTASSGNSFIYYGNNISIRQSYQGSSAPTMVFNQRPRDNQINNLNKTNINQQNKSNSNLATQSPQQIKPNSTQTKLINSNQSKPNNSIQSTQQNQSNVKNVGQNQLNQPINSNQSKPNNSIQSTQQNQSNVKNAGQNQLNQQMLNTKNGPSIKMNDNELTDIEKTKNLEQKEKKVIISSSPITNKENDNTHKGDNFKFVRKISSSFRFSRELSEFSVESRERVEFLKGLGVSCTIFEKFDPFIIHVLTNFKSNCKKISDMRRNISLFFRTQNLSVQALSYLTQFVQISPDFVVSMLIEFCTGEFAITAWPIYAISVNDVGVLTVSQEDHLIVIGFFPNYDAFASKLLTMMQNSQNQIVHQNSK